MKRRTYYRWRIFFSILFGITLNANAVDELWLQSVRVVKQSELMIPGEMIMEQTVINGDGETESESKTVLEVTGEGNKIHAQLLSLVENGKDQTQKSKAEIEQNVNKDINNFVWQMPYHLDDPNRLMRGKHAGTREINGVECIGYDFEVSNKDFENENEPFRFIGTVWLDPSTAVPLQIESHLQDLPKKEDGAEIVSLSQFVDFSYSDGIWIREKEYQELWVNAKILFKKVVAVIHTDTHYSKHWKFSSDQ
jgi:hypothetical protein